MVGMAIIGAAGLGALAEQGVRLVEEEDPSLVLGLIEDPGQVLLGLADVLGDHQRQVDLVDLAAGRAAEQAGGHGLARAGRAVEQAAVAGAQLGRHPPVVQQGVAMLDPGLDLGDLAAGAGVHK